MITNFKIYISENKIFESYKRKNPKPGDYVLCEDNTFLRPEEKEFIDNNIGRMISKEKYATNPYCIQYENIPDAYIRRGTFTYSKSDDTDDCRWFKRYEILYFSPNKEDIEYILKMRDYNL